ncbi:probable serine/threonine-protein kinase At1g54610 [Ricinus communis]|uniref:ATP binding protein, putative n=1 Tax=Ricinus communis TaxID=3988 RepID=B9RVY7_RICCO|nr:probable serine/threonine-protein kinase At1g54610 [Ricinus communis]EEF44424.1 ATP binding protein, putative [Ricinus communis]|eukprot:XP_002517906.1 probable serine/threonine-protein kinase At1g54610 [Ricinus communis]
MGCISSKDIKQKKSPKERLSRKGSLDRRVAHVNSSRREEGVRSKSKSDIGDVRVMLIDKKKNGSIRLYDDQIEKKQMESQVEIKKVENCEVAGDSHPQIEKNKKKENFDVTVRSHPDWGRVPKSMAAEQVAAGWPSWLASAAGEAIKGWVPRRANTFEKLDRIGQGTYSNVYKARDVTHDKVVAIKKVRFDINDPDSVKFMAREINILRRLDHPNIIKLEGLITSPTSSSLYLVFEYMEHDLTGLISLPGIKFKEPQIKCYMQQLLSGLDHCHSRGVLHRDIKGSNLLVDDNGILKIADFGLATFFDPHSSGQLTSRVVTLWYRAPELLLGASRYGVSVDLWSSGCILGELYTGKPILPGRTEVEQLHKIFKLCGSPSEDYWKKLKLRHQSVFKPQQPYRRCIAETFNNLPAPAVGLMETLLSLDPANRGTAAFALKDKFFRSKPFASDPSNLPKYPPSKEIDAKMRDEEARRQEAVGVGRNRTQQSLAVPASNANSKLAAMVQERRHSNANSRGEMFNSHREQTVSGFLVDPSKQTQATKEGRREFQEHQLRKVSHSGPLVHGAGWTKSGKDLDNPHLLPARPNLSTISGLVATRTSLPDDRQGEPSTSQPEVVKQVGVFQGSSNGLEPTTKQGQSHQVRKPAESHEAGGGKSTTREASLYGRGPRGGSKIYVSGPLLVPSNNVEQMLKEHDRKIQEYARKRLDKTKQGKLNQNAQGKQARENLAHVSKHSGR